MGSLLQMEEAGEPHAMQAYHDQFHGGLLRPYGHIHQLSMEGSYSEA